MKKSYLMRNFNGVEYLLFLLMLGLFIELLLKFIQKLGVTIFPEQLKLLLNTTMSDVALFIKILMLVLLILVIPELVKRLMKDKIRNLLRSIHGTLVFRKFLKQYQPSASAGEGMISMTENHAILKFNRSVHHSVLELSESEIRLYIKVPKSAQAQKILKEHEVQIKEEISNLYPEYLISTFERKKHQLWLIGTKRK
jgi:hypothetical protein